MKNRRAFYRILAGVLTTFAVVVTLNAVPSVSESTVFASVKSFLEESLPLNRAVKASNLALQDGCGDNWDDRFANALNGWVLAMAVSENGDVYVGGTFTEAGGVAANHIAKWNGSSWSALGSGVNDEVHAIAISGTDVYVGGKFNQAGGAGANRIAKWNGSSWSNLSFGMNGFVYALAVGNSGNVYAGGDFTTAGSVLAKRIARWDGSAWFPLGDGVGTDLDDYVSAIAIFDSNCTTCRRYR